MRSRLHCVSPMIPSSVMPSPKWAKAAPQAERGNPLARANAVASGTLSRPVRSTISVKAPAIT